MRVAIAYSAQRDTPDTDLRETVAALSEAIQSLGHDAVAVPLGWDIPAFWTALAGSRADVIWNLCEEACGRASLELHATALLELMNLPVTGNTAHSLSICLDKRICRDVLRGAGVPIADAAWVGQDGVLVGQVPLPAIVKPTAQDGSVGIDRHSVCQTHAEVTAAVARLAQAGLLPALCERYVEGREINVLMLGPGGASPQHIALGEIDLRGLPAGEPRILTYAGKWHPESEAYQKTPSHYPAEMDDMLRQELMGIAQSAFRALQLSGYARLDLRVDASGACHVIDVNGNPDISPDAGLQRALPTLGLDFPRFVALQLAWATAR